MSDVSKLDRDELVSNLTHLDEVYQLWVGDFNELPDDDLTAICVESLGKYLTLIPEKVDRFRREDAVVDLDREVAHMRRLAVALSPVIGEARAVATVSRLWLLADDLYEALYGMNWDSYGLGLGVAVHRGGMREMVLNAIDKYGPTLRVLGAEILAIRDINFSGVKTPRHEDLPRDLIDASGHLAEEHPREMEVVLAFRLGDFHGSAEPAESFLGEGVYAIMVEITRDRQDHV